MILSRNFNAWNKEELGSTKSKITSSEKGENVSRLEISTIVAL